MSGRAGGLYGGIQFSTTKPIASQEAPPAAAPTPVAAPVVPAQAPLAVEQPNDSGQASAKAPAGIAHLNLSSETKT